MATSPNVKPFWQSKLFWANVLGILGASAAYSADALNSGATAAVIGYGLLNIVLRFLSEKGISIR